MPFFRSRAARTLALLGTVLFSFLLTSSSVLIAQTATPAQCVDCHNKVTPNIVADWKLSKHSGVEVTCVTCHGDRHTSATDVAKVKIPTPRHLLAMPRNAGSAVQEGEACD